MTAIKRQNVFLKIIECVLLLVKRQVFGKEGKKNYFTILMVKKCALPGNRTRVARMGILHDTTTPAVLPCQPEVKN